MVAPARHMRAGVTTTFAAVPRLVQHGEWWSMARDDSVGCGRPHVRARLARVRASLAIIYADGQGGGLSAAVTTVDRRWFGDVVCDEFDFAFSNVRWEVLLPD